MGILLGPLLPPSRERGDAAIIAGALRLLREAFPQAELRGWAMTATGEPRLLQYLAETYELSAVTWSPPNFPFLSAPLKMPINFGRALAKTLLAHLGRTGRFFTACRCWGAFGCLAREIADADLVILRGGGYLSSRSFLQDLWLRWNALPELYLARSFGTPYALWGHTIWDLKGPFSWRLMRPVLRDSLRTICREHYTYNYLQSLGLPPDRLAVLPDTAFAVPRAPAARVAEILKAEGLANRQPRIGIAILPRRHPATMSRYLQAHAAAIDWLVQATGGK